MTDEPAPSPTSPAPSPADTQADGCTTAIVPVDDGSRALDAHGFDPGDYQWVPVRRRPRPDGWTEEKQRSFIATLADTGSVTQAARAIGMSAKSAYALRRAPEGTGFARAWSAAVRQGMNRLVDACLERAIEGSEEPVFDREGRVIAHRTRHHDRMAMFLLRAHMPELFRDAHRADRARGEALPPAPEPVATAMKAIDPVEPADPASLLPPADLSAALTVADLLDNELPRWHRDRDLAAPPTDAPTAPSTAASAAASTAGPGSVLGEAFERDLAAAKDGSWRPPHARRRG